MGARVAAFQSCRVAHRDLPRDQEAAQTLYFRPTPANSVGAKIFYSETDTVEQGDLFGSALADVLTCKNLPKFGHGVVWFQLLNYALNPCLCRIFHKNI